MSKRGVQSYAYEMQAHTHKMKMQLDHFHDLQNKADLNDIEYYALERVLQISIESAIGLAKHWAKLENKFSPADANSAFQMLSSYNGVTRSEVGVWKNIIGMRNTLVHGYLEVDRSKVLAVLKDRQYNVIFKFSDRAIKVLMSG